ncbi:MAG: SRPBCC domain-containing protein [Ignavibacteria bacterium]|jgi:hypothetical protein|nr:SRPBCC domain-containing protein [Ignavibacteria bacterium]
MTEKTFNMNCFTHAIILKSRIEEVYEYISTSSGIVKWFIGKAKYFYKDSHIRLGNEKARKGDSFLWNWLNKDLELKGVVTESSDNKLFSFTFSPLFFVSIELTKTEENDTRLTLRQEYQDSASKNDFAYINCCTCWVFFMTNLKSVIEYGIDLREKEAADEMMVNY